MSLAESVEGMLLYETRTPRTDPRDHDYGQGYVGDALGEIRPAFPCTEAVDADGSRYYVDRAGLAWTVDSRRLPDRDAPPALEPSLSAEEVGRKLARLYADNGTIVYWNEDARVTIQSCATALGPAVLAAFERARNGMVPR